MAHGGTRKGAGRKPRSSPREPLTVRLDQDTAEKFRALCAAHKRSQSAQFAEMVKRARLPRRTWRTDMRATMKNNEILPTIAAATRIANETTKGVSSHCADPLVSDFPSLGRRAELLDDYIRDKQQMARLLGVQLCHDRMMDEIKLLQSQNAKISGCEPTKEDS